MTACTTEGTSPQIGGNCTNSPVPQAPAMVYANNGNSFGIPMGNAARPFASLVGTSSNEQVQERIAPEVDVRPLAGRQAFNEALNSDTLDNPSVPATPLPS